MNLMALVLAAGVVTIAIRAECSTQDEPHCCSRPETFCSREAKAASIKQAPTGLLETTRDVLLAFALSLVNARHQTVLPRATSDNFSPLMKIGDQIFGTAEPWRRTLTITNRSAVQAMVFETQDNSIVALSNEASQFRDCLLDPDCSSPQVEELLIHLKKEGSRLRPVYIPGDRDNSLGRALADRLPGGTFRLPLVGQNSSASTCAYLCPVDESEYHYKAMPGAMERSLWMTAVAVLVMLGSWKGTFKFGG